MMFIKLYVVYVCVIVLWIYCIKYSLDLTFGERSAEQQPKVSPIHRVPATDNTSTDNNQT
jgi:hypothetical protein